MCRRTYYNHTCGHTEEAPLHRCYTKEQARRHDSVWTGMRSFFTGYQPQALCNGIVTSHMDVIDLCHKCRAHREANRNDAYRTAGRRAPPAANHDVAAELITAIAFAVRAGRSQDQLTADDQASYVLYPLPADPPSSHRGDRPASASQTDPAGPMREPQDVGQVKMARRRKAARLQGL